MSCSIGVTYNDWCGFFYWQPLPISAQGLPAIRLEGLPAVRRAGLSAFFVAGLSTGFMVNFFGKWSLQGSVFIQFTFLP